METAVAQEKARGDGGLTKYEFQNKVKKKKNTDLAIGGRSCKQCDTVKSREDST